MSQFFRFGTGITGIADDFERSRGVITLAPIAFLERLDIDARGYVPPEWPDWYHKAQEMEDRPVKCRLRPTVGAHPRARAQK